MEDTKHFLFNCTYYAAQREELFASVALITGHDHYALQIENLSRSNMLLKSKFMLYGDPNLNFTQNLAVLKLVQIYITDTRRFI